MLNFPTRFFSYLFGCLQPVCITRPQRVRLTDTPSLPRPRDGGGGWIWHVYYLLGPHFLRNRRAGVHEEGVATSLANYNSINEFALRTNLRTPRSVALISDAQHVRERERGRKQQKERESTEWKKQNKVDVPKIRGKSTRATAIKLDKNLAWLLKIVPSIA